jgi:hypothetical protein
MLKLANQQMLSIAGWIVAAFIILGINGAELISLCNSINDRLLTETISASVKTNQLEKFIKKIKEDEIEYRKSLKKIMLFGSKSTYSDQELPVSGISNRIKKIGGTTLPLLSGVIQVSDINGDVQSFAVIEGNKYSTDDQIDGYILREISSKGIVLTKNKKEWFVPIPFVPFSVNYKDSTAVSTQLKINMEADKPGG